MAEAAAASGVAHDVSYSQRDRPLIVRSPLPEGDLLLESFSGRERMSSLFAFSLRLRSPRQDLAAADLIGQAIGFAIRRPNGAYRHFHGHIARFAYRGTDDRLSHYQATVVPWLWFLTRRSDCRIFQHKRVPEIVEAVLQETGQGRFEMSGLRGDYPELEHCVQYRETDFDFVSRLLEREGIFYFFRHEEGQHTLVLADHTRAARPALEGEVEIANTLSGLHISDQIFSWEHAYEFRPGAYAQNDYSFEDPTSDLLTRGSARVGPKRMGAFELYDYPGDYGERRVGEGLSGIRQEEQDAGYETISAASMCCTFSPGCTFNLTHHHNRNEERKAFLITEVEHRASLIGGYVTEKFPQFHGERVPYENAIVAIPATVAYRPARETPRPIIAGAQTAVVVGPDGKEVHVDGYGRVQVRFFWDRHATGKEDSSCWIRVSQAWAGPGYGAMAIPRIGHEVIVEFLEGDPDRPIITGRVYNGDNMPHSSNAGRESPAPQKLPDATMMTSFKSSSFGGTGGHNEITMNDDSGKEGLYIRAQKDNINEILNDQTTTIGNDRNESVGINHTESIGVDSVQKIGANRTLTVGANTSIKTGANKSETVGVMATEFVGAMKVVSVGGAYAVNVGGAHTVSVGGGMNTAVGLASLEQVGLLKQINAGEKIVLSCGSSKITMESTGKITIHGSDVTLESGAGRVNIDAGGIVTVKGPMVKINT